MPTNMTTLGEVSDRVDAMNQNCHDALVDVPAISFESLETMKIGDERHTLRTVAQRSIAWRLGIPYNYLAKCPAELQAEQMNHWIKHEKREQLFVRFDGEEVRAVFTPRYKPVDNFEVIARLDEMGYTPDTKVQCSPGCASSCCCRYRTGNGVQNQWGQDDAGNLHLEFGSGSCHLCPCQRSFCVWSAPTGWLPKREIFGFLPARQHQNTDRAAPSVRESGRRTGQTEGSPEVVPGESCC